MKISKTFVVLSIFNLFLVVTCKKLEIVELTKIKTGVTIDEGLNSINITSTFIDVGPDVTEYGHCWSTSQNPDVNSSKLAQAGRPSKGNFTSNITNLEANTTYYIRSYAIENGVAVYGDEQKTANTLLMPLSITSPAAGNSWSMASKKTIIWSEDITGNVSLKLYKGGTLLQDLFTGVAADDKSIDWFIPMQLEAGLDYSVFIESESDNSIYHQSDNFTLMAQETSSFEYKGKTYNTIKIGEQWWMAENLNATSYADGTSLVDGTGAGDITGDYITRYFFNYNDDSNIGENYGKLYTWAAAMSGSMTEGVQGICPDGWHVPTETEWQTLEIELGVTESELNTIGRRGSIEGGRIKSTGTAYWQSPNTGATNESGFNALPSGFRNPDGSFGYMGMYGNIWTSTSYDSDTVWFHGVGFDYSEMYRNKANKARAKPVRCIKGEGVATEFAGEFYVYGAATDAGWTSSNAIPMQITDTKRFHGYAHLTTNSGGIKFIGGPTGNIIWGVDPGNDQLLSYASNNVAIPPPAEEGFYLIQVDFNNFTYTLTKTVWGILGTAVYPYGFWTDDKTMTYQPPYTWTINSTLADGVFKFRANSDWGNDNNQLTNLGDNLADGTLEHGGLDIAAATGGYTITLIMDPVNGYSYSVEPNASVPYIRTTFVEGHWEMGTAHDITWDDNISEDIYIQLFAGNAGTYLRDIQLNLSSDNGSYSWTIPTDLEERDDYLIKIASGTNNEVLDYSNFIKISAATGTRGTVTDYDGNTYNTIKIGLQWWMAENLKVTHYTGGDAIPLITDNVEWGNLGDNSADRAYCFYNNNSGGEANTYGALYTWAAAMNGASTSNSNPSGVQGACPVGWHLPSDIEWTEITNFLGGEDIAGGKMKSTGDLTTGDGLWTSPNDGATNESGFSGLPGGWRAGSDGAFSNIGNFGRWWSSTENETVYAWRRGLRYNLPTFENSGSHYKSGGYSVRCVKD